jgi:phage portal protein BeeE
MNLFRSLTRSDPTLGLDEWASFFSYNGLGYPLGLNETIKGHAEEIRGDFRGYVAGAYKANGVVFACMLVRLLLFSEARFQFRRLQSGRPGELFGTPALGPLEHPWPGGTTGDLLSRAIQDADLAGNFFLYRDRDRLRRMRPDWTTIVLGSESRPEAEAGDLDAEVLGYVYHPGGPSSGRDPVTLLREQVAHFAPVPDPSASYRGMSWLTPVIREIMGDGAATTHKLKFFENGATPNMVVSLDATIKQEAFERWIALFRKEHEGLANAYRTLYLGAGADAKVVGADMGQIDFKVVQGAGETRIAAAAGVPPVIVGLSEGLQAATYSNYSQARRRYADGTIRPLWRNMAGSLATVVDIPSAAELWYDDRDIPFLQEDQKDAAEIQQTQAAAIKALVEAGFRPDAVVEAIVAGDLQRLAHTGLFSVQLQPAGSTPSTAQEAGRALAALLAPHLNGKPED